MGAGRLADSALALSRRSDPRGSGAQPTAADFPLENIRQPTPEPPRSFAPRAPDRRLDFPARTTVGLDPRCGCCRRASAGLALPDVSAGPEAGGAGAGLPASRVGRVRDGFHPGADPHYLPRVPRLRDAAPTPPHPLPSA